MVPFSKIQAAVAKIAAYDDIRKRLAAVGSESVGSTPEQFGAIIGNDKVKWAEVIKASGARID